MKEKTPEARVREFIAKFEPANQRLIRAARRTMRRRFPTAIEMVYDNYNFFVIGYSPSERPVQTRHPIGLGEAAPPPETLSQASIL